MVSTNYQYYQQPQLHASYLPSAPPVDEEEKGCPICYDPFDSDTVATKCHHLFHDGCLKQHLNHGVNTNCPICRTPLSERDITHLNAPTPQPMPAPIYHAPLEPIYQPKPLTQPVERPVSSAVSAPQKPVNTSGWSNTVWKSAQFSGNVLFQMGKGLFQAGKGLGYLGYYTAQGLYHGAAYMLSSGKALPKHPKTATEVLAVHANDKLTKVYASKIKKLEQALIAQQEKVELSLSMARSVYHPSLHNTFVRALKDLTEKVNEQADMIQAGQKNFYDEGLNPVSNGLKSINDPWEGRRAVSVYPFQVSGQKAVQLPGQMTDEFMEVTQALKAAYAKQIGALKSNLDKQFGQIQVELTKVASLDPVHEPSAKRWINLLMKKVDEQFSWLENTSLDIINKEGLPTFNNTIRRA